MSGSSLQLAEYLERLPGTTFRKLYQQPSTAFAIFRRMLPDLGKNMVMALLYLPDPIPLDDLDAWVKPESKRQKDQALSVLRSLHVITISVPSKEKKQEVQLTANFRSSFRLALEGGGSHNSFGVPSSVPIPPETDLAFLDRYARRKWDEILQYVVNKERGNVTREGAGPTDVVKQLLIHGRFVERLTSANGSGITKAGFTFLLQEVNAQVWTLLLLWLYFAEHGAEGPPGQTVDMLSFLFVLASLELGRAYDTNALTEQRKNMLPFLMDIGLIYIPGHKPQQYFPTRLATTLTSASTNIRTISEGFAAATALNSGTTTPAESTPAAASAGPHKGSIILETNFRIYAYTSNPLQIAILALFAKLNMRFSDMVAGKLQRKTVQDAVRQGITADQIINYLTVHAHEQMKRRAVAENRPVLPPTVVDQVRLWQLETERMNMTSGYLFSHFEDAKEYEACASYATEIGVCVWRDDKQAKFFASKHEQIRDFLKLRKKTD